MLSTEDPGSRTRGRVVASLALAVASALVLSAMPAGAQGDEEFPGPADGAPLSGYTRSDGTVVLSDDSFCRLLLGTLWGDQKLTYARLIDRSKQQKKARKAAFAATDEATVGRCVDVIAAYRQEAPDDAAADPLVAWARRAPVVPEALAALLPADLVARPLADPGTVGDAARTSGFGDLVSAPFPLTGGTWLAELDALACDEWSGTLRDARDPEAAIELEGNREYLYDIAAGHYYWDVTAPDCDWSVDLVPFVLGPVPTPTPEPRAIVPALFGPSWDRFPDRPNPDFLRADEARAAVLAAGLVTGTCTPEGGGGVRDDRVWRQEPAAGTLVEFGTPVDVWVGLDCDIYTGDRVPTE